MNLRLKTQRLLPRTLLALVALALAVVLLALWSGPADAATTFTVNKTGDAKDIKISDTRCDSSPDRGNQCTLRAAIQESNDTTGADTINFNIVSDASVKTIKPAKPLPAITEAVTINGYSQGSTTTTTSDDARENTLAEGNDAVLKIQLNGINAGSANGLVIEASDSTVKGLVINRFAGNGVLLSGSGATGNKIEGNFIGTNAAGSAGLGNGDDGVDVSGADDNTVGGTTAGARNVISGNNQDGIQISGNASIGVATGNEVLGNFIGTNATGNAALGNSGDGVEISQAEDNTIGGTVSAARNIISGNGGDGVVLFGTDATGNKVQGNFIGTGANGTTALGNDDGVAISSASDSTIGSAVGSTAGGNRIANNDQDGVLVFGGLAVGNRILSNSIFSNGETSIDLGGGTEDSFGVTANDDDDPDAPSSNNHRQNFPVITSAIRSSTTNFTTITGTLNSNPSQSFTVQCFVAAPDPSGHGEGQVPAGADTTVTTDSGGDGSFSCGSPVPQAGQFVTATATNTSGTATGTAIGDTSEFSQNQVVFQP